MTGRNALAAVTGHVRRPLYRDAYALVISSGLTSVLGVAYWAVAARAFSADAVGIAAVVLSTSMLLSSLTQLNARVALVRFVPESGRHTARFVALWYVSTAVLGVIAGVALIWTIDIWASASPPLAVLRDPGLGIWFIASIAVLSLFNIQDGLLTGLGRATIVPFENGVYALSKLGLLAALTVWSGTAALLVSWTAPAALLVVVVGFLAFTRLIPAHTARPSQRPFPMTPSRLVRFLALDYGAYVLAAITATLLPTIVVALSGPAQGAYFYIPWVILTSMMLVPVYLATSLTVQAANDREALKGLRRLFIHIYRLLLPIVLVVVLFAPVILQVFGQSYAAEGSDLLRVAAVGLLPYAVNVLYLAVARVRSLGRIIVLIQACLMALTLGLSIILLPALGIVGVGLAWTAANGIVAIFVFWFGLRSMLTKHELDGANSQA